MILQNDPTKNRNKEEIAECERKLLKAFRESDMDVIDELLHDSMLFNTPTGKTVTKEMDMANLRSGIMTIKEMIASNRTIHVIGDVATVVMTIHLKALYADNLIGGNFRFLRVWKLCDDTWKVVAASGFQLL